MIRKLAAGLVAGLTLATVPAAAGATHPNTRFDTVVDVVVETSGAPGAGFDHNRFDYDILREALVATGLVEAVAAADDITVFAPRDSAFIRLARDLGYDGRDEAGVFAFIAEATGFQSAEEPGLLADVLLYHVAPEGQSLRQLRRAGQITTLLEGATLDVRRYRVIDADTDDRDARFRWPSNVETGNGVVHTVNRVLRPIDLP